MAERSAVNASPLIFLSRASLLDLLQMIFPGVIVPETVAMEIEHRGVDDPTAWALSKALLLKSLYGQSLRSGAATLWLI